MSLGSITMGDLFSSSHSSNFSTENINYFYNLQIKKPRYVCPASKLVSFPTHYTLIRYLFISYQVPRLSWWLTGKEFPCQCRRHGFNPWVGKIPLEKAMAPHSSTLAWKIPWMEEPGSLQPMGLQRVGHDWETSLSRTLKEDLKCLFFSRHPHPLLRAGEKEVIWALLS